MNIGIISREDLSQVYGVQIRPELATQFIGLKIWKKLDFSHPKI